MEYPAGSENLRVDPAPPHRFSHRNAFRFLFIRQFLEFFREPDGIFRHRSDVWIVAEQLNLSPGQRVRVRLLPHLYPCLSALFMNTSYHTNLSRSSVHR
jgi:hypothetical protein